MCKRGKDTVSFEGTTGPYMQYTYAWEKRILRKCEIHDEVLEMDYKVLTDDVVYALVKVIAGYEEAVKHGVPGSNVTVTGS